MNKQEYLSRLERALSGLPGEELQERLAFSVRASMTGWKKA